MVKKTTLEKAARPYIYVINSTSEIFIQPSCKIEIERVINQLPDAFAAE
jgi:isopropylmalate/homocitrate/citramalate synthase